MCEPLSLAALGATARPHAQSCAACRQPGDTAGCSRSAMASWVRTSHRNAHSIALQFLLDKDRQYQIQCVVYVANKVMSTRGIVALGTFLERKDEDHGQPVSRGFLCLDAEPSVRATPSAVVVPGLGQPRRGDRELGATRSAGDPASVNPTPQAPAQVGLSAGAPGRELATKYSPSARGHRGSDRGEPKPARLSGRTITRGISSSSPWSH